MCTKILANDLNNCLINFDNKVLVTSLLDEYGGLLEDIAKTVADYLSSEEAKGKLFQKHFILNGIQLDSDNEIVTIVPEGKLDQKKKQLENASSLLYSAEAVGGSKSPPQEFAPLKVARIKLSSLEVREMTKFVIKESVKAPAKPPAPKRPETVAAIPPVLKSPEKIVTKKPQPEAKSGTLGAMFKKQEAANKNSKSPEESAAKKTESGPKSGTINAMFKKQETAAKTTIKTEKKSPETSKTTKSPTTKLPTPKKTKEPVKKGAASKKIKEEPAANVSVNLFEENSSSSEDEEALDALKRQVLTDEEDDKPSTSNKRRRILDSDEDEEVPEAKTGRCDDATDKEVSPDAKANASTVFIDDDGFVVTVKSKGRKSAPASKPVVNMKLKKSPLKKSPTKTPVKKGLKTPTKKKPDPAPAKKQGNIMNFLIKK